MVEAFPEWVSGGGVFSAMKNPPWEGSVDPLELDLQYYAVNSGEKNVSVIVTKFIDENGALSVDSIGKIAALLLSRYGKNWRKLWETLLLEYNPISNYEMTEEYEGNFDSERTDENLSEVSSESESNVFGFNSSTASPANSGAGRGTESKTGKGTDTETRSHRLTRSGNIGVTTSQQMIQSERDLWVWDFFQGVFRDVDSVLTIPIYSIRRLGEEYGANTPSTETSKYELPAATADVLGGVQADPKQSTDTQPVRIGADNKLYTQPADKYNLSPATADVLGGVQADPKQSTDTQPVRIGADNKLYTAPGQGGAEYELPTATADVLGGVRADAKQATDTQPVRIGSDGKLYTAPGQGGSGTGVAWLNVSEMFVQAFSDSPTTSGTFHIPKEDYINVMTAVLNGSPLYLTGVVLRGNTETTIAIPAGVMDLGGFGQMMSAAISLNGMPLFIEITASLLSVENNNVVAQYNVTIIQGGNTNGS